MKLSEFPLYTLKETPADAEVVSHQLMLRSGMIRRLAAGVYSWLPLGLRVLRRVERVVREEMDGIGALEIMMPAVQPAELWQESGRWQAYGPELLRLRDRHERDFCFGPTHEEVISDLVRSEIRSYRQLPAVFYQIQTKFRDEIRPRFGVMRSREFLMKDAYSFHLDRDSLQRTYDSMFQAYCRIFQRLGLDYRPVLADTGSIGGSHSHEFHVLADAGEDRIAFSDGGDFAANVELAEALAPDADRPPAQQPLERIHTPGQTTIDAIATFLGVEARTCIKTLLVAGAEGGVVALCLRGDHQLNPLKAEKLPQVASPLRMAEAGQVRAATGAGIGSVGPVSLEIPVIADRSAAACADFVCGANRDDYHLTGVNWGRDLPEPAVADLREVQEGDPSPDGSGSLRITRGIEVGHVFQLGDKYSRALDVCVLDEDSKRRVTLMGCYGIGVSRIVAAAIEQNHDPRGIVWPQAMAPFQVAILPINAAKSQRVRAAAARLHDQLARAGFDVVLDDRGLRPGAMFADAELIGIPHRLVIAERGLDAGQVEYKGRRDAEPRFLDQAAVEDFLRDRCQNPGGTQATPTQCPG